MRNAVQALTDARRVQEEALPSADVDSCGQVVSLQHEHRLILQLVVISQKMIE